MELIAYLFYIFANWAFILLFVGIFGSVGAFGIMKTVVGAFSGMPPPPQHERPSLWGRFIKTLFSSVAVGLFLFMIGLAVLSFVHLLRPHLINGPLIVSIGEQTDARVLTKATTNNLHNEKPVIRYNVIYKTAAGQTIETYFESWDFNIYPSSGSVRYPQPGETFRIAYLPSFPKVFIIMTEADSESKRARDCGRLISELQIANGKRDFDPTDANFRKAAETAEKAVRDAGCLGNNSGASTDLPAMGR